MFLHLWVATLLRKDNHDQLDSIYVEAANKHHALEKSREIYAERYKEFWHYSYVWVTLKTENTRAV